MNSNDYELIFGDLLKAQEAIGYTTNDSRYRSGESAVDALIREYHGAVAERDNAHSREAFMREGIEAYQSMISVFCIGVNKSKDYKILIDDTHAVKVFEWERTARRREAGLE